MLDLNPWHTLDHCHGAQLTFFSLVIENLPSGAVEWRLVIRKFRFVVVGSSKAQYSDNTFCTDGPKTRPDSVPLSSKYVLQRFSPPWPFTLTINTKKKRKLKWKNCGKVTVISVRNPKANNNINSLIQCWLFWGCLHRAGKRKSSVFLATRLIHKNINVQTSQHHNSHAHAHTH